MNETESAFILKNFWSLCPDIVNTLSKNIMEYRARDNAVGDEEGPQNF